MNKSIPKHLGVIIDGNRRWARERDLPTFEGHKKGLEKLKSLIKWTKARGVKILTVYIFSTENWNRSKEEVNYLMNLFRKVFKNNFTLAEEENIKVKVIGERKGVPEDIREIINEIESETEKNNEMQVNFAFSYGGRKEILHSVKEIVKQGKNPDDITEKDITENLYIPNGLDLVIRTSEKRVSNFLIWQLAYAEFYFLYKYWPAFTEKDLDDAFLDYKKRQRRYGQ
jgi:undecaprenyl diphosphate synthase